MTSLAGNFCIFTHNSVYVPPSLEAMNREIVWRGLFYELASRYFMQRASHEPVQERKLLVGSLLAPGVRHASK